MSRCPPLSVATATHPLARPSTMVVGSISKCEVDNMTLLSLISRFTSSLFIGPSHRWGILSPDSALPFLRPPKNTASAFPHLLLSCSRFSALIARGRFFTSSSRRAAPISMTGLRDEVDILSGGGSAIGLGITVMSLSHSSVLSAAREASHVLTATNLRLSAF